MAPAAPTLGPAAAAPPPRLSRRSVRCIVRPREPGAPLSVYCLPSEYTRLCHACLLAAPTSGRASSAIFTAVSMERARTPPGTGGPRQSRPITSDAVPSRTT